MAEQISLYKQLEDYANSDFYPYHMPGHKRRQMGKMPEQLLRADITEIDGFDNLHQADGILRRVQESANALYHADETFYLINGSTAGILSAVSAALPENGHLLMARNCHKSVYHAAYLRHLRLSYLYPETVSGFSFCEAVTAEQVKEALEQESDIGAVLIVSPTYEGRIADVRAIAKVVHAYGVPLIVDEAHGAHLGFAEGFAEGSCTQRADLVIHSVHKTLPAMTQTALLHVNGNLIDRDQLRRFLRIYQSSSPSYVLMSSIDDAMETIRRHGQELFSQFRRTYGGLAKHLQKCKVLRFIPWEDVEQGRQDIGKLVISMDVAAINRIFRQNGKTGDVPAEYRNISGKWLYDTLRRKYHLQCEMASGNDCLAMFTLADGKEAYDRMEQALLEIDDGLAGDYGMIQKPEQKSTNAVTENIQRNQIVCNRPDIRYPFSDAWDMPWKLQKLSEAVGCAVGEFVNLYPPGTPVLVPGEVLTDSLYAQILDFQRKGLELQGIIDKAGVSLLKILI